MARFDPRMLLIPLVGLPLLVFALARTATRAAESAPTQPSAGPNVASTADQNAAATCPAKSLLVNYEVDRYGRSWNVPIWQYANGDAFSFTSGMTIDADGAPNAYNADNTGLDDLANAGSPGHWFGILQDENGDPMVQGPDDPYPGYYISCTALADWSKPPHDPARFVDASKIPYIVLPGDLAREMGARPGDLAVAMNLWNGNYSYAIFADIGTLGEGSIALAKSLGISPDARHGGTWWGVLYLVFPNSGDHRPKSIDEIDQETAKLLSDWGGVVRLNACANDEPRPSRPPFTRADHTYSSAGTQDSRPETH